jgi:hypothetical protein
MKKEFNSHEEYRNYVLKCLDNIRVECLNLEIQTSQIKDDAAARGANVAVEFIRKDLSEVINLIEDRK